MCCSRKQPVWCPVCRQEVKEGKEPIWQVHVRYVSSACADGSSTSGQQARHLTCNLFPNETVYDLVRQLCEDKTGWPVDAIARLIYGGKQLELFDGTTPLRKLGLGPDSVVHLIPPLRGS